ncbi:MAG: DUF927 domain-containing protein, partial [Aeromonas sp.]
MAVVEGYATGHSVNQATGARTYCAMDAGNLLAVAQIARLQHPHAPIWICGDNDHHADGAPNVGKDRAEAAARATDGLIVLPPLVDGRPTDWNDHTQAHGAAVTAEVMARIAKGEGIQNGTGKDKGAAQEEKGGWEANQLPPSFRLEGNRLCALVIAGRGEQAREEWHPIASPVSVLAVTSNADDGDHGRLLEWRTEQGRVKRWAMPMEALVPRNGEAVYQALLAGGLPFIDLERKRKLGAYLMACRPDRHVTCVTCTGWHGGAYVLPDGALGNGAGAVMLQGSNYAASDFTEAGSLAEWRANVAALAVGNSRLAFALSLAFAAPLLRLAGMDGGGFHLKGDST